MRHRIATSPIIQALFSNIPIESDLPDEEIVVKVMPHIPHKTFSKLRIKVGNTITPEQLLVVARLSQSALVAGSDDVIGIVRNLERYEHHPLYATVMSRTFSRSKKDLVELAAISKAYALTSKKIYLFDRADSLEYLRPISEEHEENAERCDRLSITNSRWLARSADLRYSRLPRIFAVMACGSLDFRTGTGSDAAIEHLIGNVDSGEHSLTIVDDCIRRQHRIFRGILAEAQAVSIFDRRAMLVFPNRQRSIRLYESASGQPQSRLIADCLRYFCQMRKFRTHAPTVASVRSLLRERLSYHLPGWDE